MDAISLDTARQALQVIPSSDRATRVRIGEALRDEYGDAAFDAFDDWYSKHDRYTQSESKQAWKSFGKGGGKTCTIGTLIYEAKRNGFRFNRTHQVKHTPEEAKRLEAEKAQRRAALAAEAAAEAAAAAARAQAIWDAADQAPEGHAYLVRKGIKPQGVRRAREWVKEWTNYETGEIRTMRFADPLLVPIWSAPGKLASLQAIFPSKCIGPKDERRDKDYLSGGQKLGCYFLLGRITKDTQLVVFCEGYATGASLHEATGLPVVVCFDAGNLEPVATMMRGKLPQLRMVFAADNDQFHPPEKGNPGVDAATKAAKAVDGVLVVPQFDDLSAKPTDFNDLHALKGIDAVRAAIDLALNPPPAPAPAPKETAPWEGDGEQPAAAPAAAGEAEDEDEDEGPAKNGYFVILGYNHTSYYVFVHCKRQLLEIGKGDMGDKGLIEIAPLDWWEVHFPGDKGKIDTSAAANFLIHTAHKKGIYDPSRIRGRGAWIDDKRIVYHHGSHLTVDGKETDITQIKSRYVYELDISLPLPAEEPMSSEEGEALLDLAKRFRWHTPGSAALLAGWVALAPLCGALKWRPHLWITGGAGSGKSSCLNRYVQPLLGEMPLYAQGNSTEAGIRQKLKADARPVMFDESESNEERDAQRVQSVLSLIRQASTESAAQTLKGSAGGDAVSYHIRSMFCLASIQVALKQKADTDRLTVLALKSPSQRGEADPAAEWESFKAALYEGCERDETLPARLFRRSLDLLPTTLTNIDVFVSVAAKKFNNQRDGDQYGTLLAGAWSLVSTQVATREQAQEWIDSYDWSEHRELAESDESQKALSALMGAHIRAPGGIEVTVYELVATACGHKQDGVDLSRERANSFLARHGLRVKGDRLMLSNNSQELKRLMAGTGFEADLRGVMLRVPGADKNDNKAVKFNGVTEKVVSLPLEPIVGSVLPEDDTPPF